MYLFCYINKSIFLSNSENAEFFLLEDNWSISDLVI